MTLAGHYMKIPPRTMFWAQLFAVTWLSLVQIATYNFLRGNIKGICTTDQAEGLTCPNAKTFFNASVIWGVVGPKRMFCQYTCLLSICASTIVSTPPPPQKYALLTPNFFAILAAGALYSWTNWFWFIGAACPAIQFFVARKFPRSPLRYIFFPAIFGAAGMIPPATAWYLGQWVIVGLIFNYFIKKRYFGWWSTFPHQYSPPPLPPSLLSPQKTSPEKKGILLLLTLSPSLTHNRSLQLRALGRPRHWHRLLHRHRRARAGSQRCGVPRLVGQHGAV